MLPTICSAQALDIGGVELRLGQDVTAAVAQLKSLYDVSYDDASKTWFVSKRKTATEVTWLGNIEANGGRVARLTKAYTISNEADVITPYTLAMREVQRRGGTTCSTAPIERTDDSFHEVRTTCGAYSLTLHLPWVTTDGAHVVMGVSIAVGRSTR